MTLVHMYAKITMQYITGIAIHCRCSYEPVQPIRGSSHGVTLIPLDTSRLDLDTVQRLQHGTTVIHYDSDSTRSTLCLLQLDPSCTLLSWHRVAYGNFGGKEVKDKVSDKGNNS